MPSRYHVWSEIRSTALLGLPLVAAQLAQMSMSLIDTLMVGRLGTVELAGVALGAGIFYPVTIVCSGVLMAVSPMVSQAYGAGDRGAAGRSVRQGLWLAVILSGAAFFALREAAVFLRWIGQAPEVVAQADGYLDAVAFGAPGLMLFGVLRQLVEGVSRPRIILVITLGGVVLNVVANTVLMFGYLGFPALGLVGCGWATALVYTAMAAALAGFVGRFFGEYGVFARLGRPDPALFVEIFRLGWPIGLMMLLEGALFSASGMLMGLIGTVQLAAHQVALNSAAYVYMLPLGLSFAVSVRVGQAVGRQDPNGARRAGLVGIGMGAASMIASALAFLLIPAHIMGLFVDRADPANDALIRQGAALLRVAAVFQIADGIQVTSAGALRGLKETRVPMLVAAGSYWLVGFTLAWVLAFQLDWGPEGLWWGMVAGLTTAAVLLGGRFVMRVRVPAASSR